MSIPPLPSTFGPSAWGALDALSPLQPSAAARAIADARLDASLDVGLFSRHDEASPIGVSAMPGGSTPGEFRDRLIACLCEPG